MSPKKLMSGVVVVLLSSVLGIWLGNAFAQAAKAKDKVRGRKVNSARALSSPSDRDCPTIKFQPLSVQVEDSSANEGLSVRHSSSENVTGALQITGLLDGVYAPVMVSFVCTYSVNAQTIVTGANPNLSLSIALVGVEGYASVARQPFLNGAVELISRGGVTNVQENSLKQGVIQNVVMLQNGTYPINLYIDASAITSTDSDYGAAYITLDLLDASFVSDSNTAKKYNVTPVSPPAKQCYDNCGKVTQAIDETIADLMNRYNEAQNDYDLSQLYCNAYKVENPLDGKGSWCGHKNYYNGKQTFLINLLGIAEKLLCNIAPDAEEWATRPYPDKPLKYDCDLQLPCPPPLPPS